MLINILKKLALLNALVLFTCSQYGVVVKDDDTKLNSTVNTYGRISLSIKSNNKKIISTNDNVNNIRTITPDLNSSTIDSYDLTADGPGDASLDVTNITNNWNSEDLVAGDWIFTIIGKDASDNVVASGSVDVTLLGNIVNPVSIEISPVSSLSGHGKLNILIDWTAEINIKKASYSINGGAYIDNNITGNSFSYNDTLDSDSYLFIIKLKDDSDNLMALLLETVYIFDNLVTRWEKTLQVDEINSPPKPPLNLQLREGNNKSVNIFWEDGSDIETGYFVERSEDNGMTFSVISGASSLPANTIAYMNSTAEFGTNYTYRVRAENTFGFSDYTDNQSLTIDKPLVLSIDSPSSGEIDVEPNSQIKIRFNKSMSIKSGIFRFGTPALELKKNNCRFMQATTDITNDTIILSPKIFFEPGCEYSDIEISDFYDKYNNPIDISSDTTYNFKTKYIPPEFQFGYPTVNTVSHDSFNLSVATDQSGNCYFVVLDSDSVAPSETQIKEGKDADGNSLSSNKCRTITIPDNNNYDQTINGLDSNTNYDVYILHENSSYMFSEIAKIEVKTTKTYNILFAEDFDDESNNTAPPYTAAVGTWDNSLLLTTDAEIDNSTNKVISGTYKLALKNNKEGYQALLGGSFNPAIKRYLVTEYEVKVSNPVGTDYPVAELYLTDGTDDLTGIIETKVAVHIEFSDNKGIDGDSSDDKVYYTVGQDSDASHPNSDGSEHDTGITWANNTWYKVQLILDQTNNQFDIYLTDVSTEVTQSATGSYNENTAGNIQKVWFATSNSSTMFIDNINIYHSDEKPNIGYPSIVFNQNSTGFVRTNPPLDVDFFDDSLISMINYKIGKNGDWKQLRDSSDLQLVFPISSPASYTSPVYISNDDYNTLSEGLNKIYFKIADDKNDVVSDIYYEIKKDTTLPTITTGKIDTDNLYILIDFSEEVWGNDNATQSIETTDFNIELKPNGGVITNVTIEGLYSDCLLSNPLNNIGYKSVYVKLEFSPTGLNPSGLETTKVTVLSNSIFDRAGNPVNGTQTTGELSFYDKKTPTITNLIPENDSTDILQDNNISFSFDEDVVAVSQKFIYIKRSTDDTIFRIYEVTNSGNIVISNSRDINIVVDNYFENGEGYYIEIDSGAFIDSNNNPFLGISNKNEWNFTIESL